MQPEEIIQNKEWQDLTAEEKAIVLSLAGDEQEYNLIKKMLMVADESADDVPVISPAVQSRIHGSFKTGNQRRSNTKWLYAAAAVIAMAICAWLLLQNKKDSTPEIVDTPSQKQEEIKKDTAQQREIITPQQQDIPKPEITHQPPSKEDAPEQPQKDDIIQDKPAYASISTLIKDDTTLMAFVTEVY
jgi:hypothetical protein